MKLAELENARRVAGARYAVAVAELRPALIDLASIDAALCNGNVPCDSVATFPALASEHWPILCHPDFSPSFPPITEEVAGKRDALLAAFETA